jgi:hypothetical protein
VPYRLRRLGRSEIVDGDRTTSDTFDAQKPEGQLPDGPPDAHPAAEVLESGGPGRRGGLLQPGDVERAEIERLLAADTTTLAIAAPMLIAGSSPAEVAEALGNEKPGQAWQLRIVTDAFVNGDLPTGRAIGIKTRQAFQRVLRQPMSEATRALLIENLGLVEKFVADAERSEAASDAAQQVAEQAEQSNQPGVYVYTLQFCVDTFGLDSDEPILFKVGKAEGDMDGRMGQQRTGCPKQVAARYYPTPAGEARTFEARFHKVLKAFGRQEEPGTRREWFICTIEQLDTVAEMLGLEIVDAAPVEEEV